MKSEEGMYNSSLRHAEYCGAQTWQVFGIFSIVHTVFAGGLLREYISKSNEPILILPSTLGLVACILWLATYERTRGYYKLRMAQTRHFEPKSKVGLVSKLGYDFSNNKCVTIDGNHYQHTWLARIFPIELAVRIIIFLFAIYYLSFIYYILI